MADKENRMSGNGNGSGPSRAELQARAATLGVKGRSKMSPEELGEAISQVENPPPGSIPDLVGTAEAAELLDVERPRIGRWLKSGLMPEPVQRLAATPIWTRRQIEAMREERESRRRTAAV